MKEPLLTEVIEAYKKGEIQKNFEGAIMCRPFESYNGKGFWVGSGFIEDYIKAEPEIQKIVRQTEIEIMWGKDYKTNTHII
jgi:hypothetical protein